MILSHTLPRQVERLAQAIRDSSKASAVLVVHDARASESPRPAADRVHVLAHDLDTDWGSWEIVEATLLGLREARRRFDPAMVAIVSGQDYPTRSLSQWEAGFLARGGWQGRADPLVYRPRWGRPYGAGDDEFTRYAYSWRRLPWGRTLGTSALMPVRLLREGLFKAGHYLEPAISVRTLPRGRGLHVGRRWFRPPFDGATRMMKGSQWLALDRAALDHVLQRDGQDRHLRRTYERSVIPDEGYLQTMLAAWRPAQDGPPLAYVCGPRDGSDPGILDLRDLPDIEDAGSPFCRKVAPGASDELMAVLDARCLADSEEGAISYDEGHRQPESRDRP